MLPLLTLLLLGSRAVADSSEDKIIDLPGLSLKVNFSQYSGYLQADEDNFFHYWFVESERSPTQDPLILWLNGGPGCSSMDGLLHEMGPFTPDQEGKNLTLSPHSWNTFANLLFLESPECTGFSYNTKKDCKTSDNATSMKNLAALKEFFKKFPEFRSNDFYITGEGYAGVYIPTLALRILLDASKDKINLKGLAVGNGKSAEKEDNNSVFFFGYLHGLLDQGFWDEMVGECCENGNPTRATCEFAQTEKLACAQKVQKAMQTLADSGLNMFNLYADCLHPSNSSSVPSDSGSQRNGFDFMSNLGEHGDPPCTDYSHLRNYLNRADVKAAIHVKEEIEWQMCSVKVLANYEREYNTTKWVYEYVFSQGIPALAYSGDVDMYTNHLVNDWFFKSFNLTVAKKRREWHVDQQVAGYVKRLAGSATTVGAATVDVLTVKGAGHMVPRDRPAQALHMIQAFTEGEDY